MLKLGQALTQATARLEKIRGDSGLPRTPSLVAATIGLLLIVPLIAFSILLFRKPQVEREALANLKSIVVLEADQVEDWLTERRGDAYTFSHDPEFCRDAVSFLRTRDPYARQNMLTRMEAVRGAYGYWALSLVDQSGRTLLRVGEAGDPPDETKDKVSAALATRTFQRTRLFSYPQGSPEARLDFVVPISIESDPLPPQMALVFEAAPERTLFPTFQHWPAASPTGETALIDQDDQTLMVLTGFGKRGEPVRVHVINRLSAESSSVFLFNPQDDTKRGIDQRGVEVLAAKSAVRGTDWFVVSKIDYAEAVAPVYLLVFWVSLVGFTMEIGIAYATFRLWREQRRSQRLALAAETAKADRLLRQFFDLPFVGMAIVSSQTREFLEFNGQMCRILGCTAGEMREKAFHDVIRPADPSSAIDELMDAMSRGESQGSVTEQRLLRKDGVAITASIDVKCSRKPDGSLDSFVLTIDDMTERRRAEAALLESEQRFRRLAENAQDLIFRYELIPRRAFTYVSPAAATFTGFTPEEHYADPDLGFNLVHPDDRPLLEAASADDQSWVRKSIVLRWIKRNGETIWTEQRLVAVRDPEGRLVALEGIARDVTDQKKADALLRESEKRYRALFENMTDGFAYCKMLYDDRGRPMDFVYLDINAAFTEMTGIKDVIGRRVSELVPGIRETNPEALELYGRVAAGGTPEKLETYMIHLRKWFTLSVYSPEKDCFAAVFTDTTRLRESQRALRQFQRAVEQSSTSIMITDTTGIITYVNPGFVKASGYASEEVVGKNPRFLSSGMTSRAEYKRLWDTISAGGQWTGEFSNRRKNGQLYWELATISPLRGDTGAITHFVAVQEDITQRMEMEAALREREAMYRFLADNMVDAITTADVEQGKYIYASPSVRQLLGYTSEELVSMPAGATMTAEAAAVQEALLPQRIATFLRGDRDSFVDEVSHVRKDGKIVWTETVTRFVAPAGAGRVLSISVLRDTTARRRNAQVTQARFRLAESAASHQLNEILLQLLDDALTLSGSRAAFVYQVESDRKGLSLLAWSSNPRSALDAQAKAVHRAIDDTGIWSESVRSRRPAIHNDVHHPPHSPGTLEGDLPVTRELVVPVIRSGQMVALLCVANKESDYDQGDVEGLSLMADLSWDVIERKRAEERLVRVRLAENERIGRELHDGLGAHLTGIRYALDSIAHKARGLNAPEIGDAVSNCSNLLRESHEYIRTLARSFEAAELAKEPFIEELRKFASTVETLFGIDCTLSVDPAFSWDNGRSGSDLLQIIHEAVNNAVRHGNPGHIWLTVGPSEIVIENDGLDFPGEDNVDRGVGIRSMRQRAQSLGGQMEFKVRTRGGTTCRLILASAAGAVNV